MYRQDRDRYFLNPLIPCRHFLYLPTSVSVRLYDPHQTRALRHSFGQRVFLKSLSPKLHDALLLMQIER
jgi:hypothetical protein